MHRRSPIQNPLLGEALDALSKEENKSHSFII